MRAAAAKQKQSKVLGAEDKSKLGDNSVPLYYFKGL